MKPIKIVLVAAGVLGLLATFALPYISVEGMSMKFWDFRALPDGLASGLLNGPKQVYIALVGFLMLAGAGAAGLAAKRLPRGAAIAGAIGALLCLATEGVRKGLLGGGEGMSTAIGGKLLFLAALTGLVASIIGAAKPEKA